MAEQRTLTVLLADDEVEVGEFFKEDLERACVSVDYVPTTQKALEQLAAKKYDIVFTDLNQAPTGVEVFKKARESGADAYIITGGALPGLMDEARQVAGDHLIMKPFQMKTIYEIIERNMSKEKPQS